MTKILLTFVLCTQVGNQCLPPIEGKVYDDNYTCMVEGYEKSLEIVKELGMEEINEKKYYVKFMCTETNYNAI